MKNTVFEQMPLVKTDFSSIVNKLAPWTAEQQGAAGLEHMHAMWVNAVCAIMPYGNAALKMLLSSANAS
jgi:hypothetical protein